MQSNCCCDVVSRTAPWHRLSRLNSLCRHRGGEEQLPATVTLTADHTSVYCNIYLLKHSKKYIQGIMKGQNCCCFLAFGFLPRCNFSLDKCHIINLIKHETEIVLLWYGIISSVSSGDNITSAGEHFSSKYLNLETWMDIQWHNPAPLHCAVVSGAPSFA